MDPLDSVSQKFPMMTYFFISYNSSLCQLVVFSKRRYSRYGSVFMFTNFLTLIVIFQESLFTLLM